MKYSPVIGLEVHVELKTKSKMFCSCSSDYFGKKPNTHTCPVCLGLPGALPVPNKQAIDWCFLIGLSLNCKINKLSKFDRKNYFYPDLAKGYQISQYDLPFCYDGYIKLKSGKKIGINRVHMEEDTGKLVHDGNSSLVDFNRSGVPLVEIVTEPDFESASEVKEYLQKLHQIVRYIDVSNADMEKGEMRLEPNISLRELTQKSLPNYKVEVKNINSFKFVEKAINFELKRQQIILEKGDIPKQETRGWNDNKQITFSQRSKEEAHDYRYFPEPDIPPIKTTKSQITKLIGELLELPETKMTRFINDYLLPEHDAEILTREKVLADYFEKTISIGTSADVKPKQIANYIINKKVDIYEISPKEIIKAIKSAISTNQVDPQTLKRKVNEVIAENEKAVSDYKKGKVTIIMFLVGQVMKKFNGKADAKIVKSVLEEKLLQ